MSKIWIVKGRCGEYSDKTEWVVAWYESEESANAHAKEATAWAKENGEAWRDAQFGDGDEPRSPFDPYFDTDYTGTDYIVEWVERGRVSIGRQ